MTRRIEVNSTVNALDDVMAFVDGSLKGMDVSRKSVLQLELAVEEIFVNIANYAYHTEGGKVWISCDVDAEDRSVAITFMDTGPEFDPLAAPDPDVTLPADQRRIGGLGIFLVKTNVDNMSYKRLDGYNVLTIEKNLARYTQR